MTRLRRVLIANRGEIAVRIARACFDEGVECVAAVSDADLDALVTRRADAVVRIGPAHAGRSYLHVGAIVGAALATGCDAVHPGYGFLSEQPELARACAEHGLTFVGPSAEVIARGGDKIAARELARSLRIPVGAGSDRVGSPADALAVARDVGFPLLLKAAAGGGGRGMVRVDDDAALAPAFAAASREAHAAFGDGTLFVERFVARARHVEVQVLGDRHGTVIHLGERDCSAQRRYQKLVEEAPAPDLPDRVRAGMRDAAVRLARALGYVGAGTCEFLLDADRDEFAFLELNTRVQVEHPVTELVTGVDIVRAQLRIAAGEPLPLAQDEVRVRGHAVECRINAEDARAGFAPAPGRIARFTVPEGDGVRVDTHCADGAAVPPHYDSLLAKLICWGPDRATALRRMDRALARVRIDGVSTTAAVQHALVRHADFRAGRVTTGWVEDTFLPAWSGALGPRH